MDPARWKRIEEVFSAAIEADEADRRQVLERLCAGDDALRAEVEAMLDATGEEPELAIEERLDQHASERDAPDRGARVGPYTLDRPLGEGGMGVVWLAEQSAPVRRQVALKIIKLGMDTEQVVARFESERQALARMTHPNIAQVFDAGATEAGRPYFAMELVQGKSLNEHCDQARLNPTQRIELFLDVCHGVQHAHLKGVIHRDLKPSNVLVTRHDGKDSPKIIDFGIAKAMDDKLVDETLVTRVGHALGTPAYMSPEQADTANRDVDTRSDIYSLGVMLYELLVGALPADRETIEDLAARHSLGELRVPRPSVRLTGLGDTGARVAAARATTLDSLRRTLVGDLDWIVLKAMEKDRSRRYSSVEALANDLRRYLAHLPIEARPPSLVYQFSKFARRHRVAVVAATAIGVAVLAGAGLATYGMIRARNAEREALQDAETARRVQEFMVGIFRLNHPYESLGEQVTARELLDRAAEQVQEELVDQPLVQAELRAAIGGAFRSLGMYDRAEPHLLFALDARMRLLPADDLDVVAALHGLGELRIRQSRWTEAEELLGRALAILEARLGPDHENVAYTLSLLGQVYERTADFERARAVEKRSLAIRRVSSGPRRIAESLRQLGILEAYESRFAEAMVWYEEAYAVARQGLGEDHLVTLDIRESMALSLQGLGRLDEALAIQRAVLAGRERILGAEHPIVAFSLHNLGRNLSALDRHAEAIPWLERSLQVREDALGPASPFVGDSLETLAIARAVTGDLDAAAELFERTLSIYEDSYGPRHPETVETLQNLAILAMYRKRPDLAIARLELAVERGFGDLETLGTPPLDGLAGDPRYDALVERLQSPTGD